MGYVLAEMDLAHIRNVVSHLEQLADSARASDTGAMPGSDYWRARIRAILALPLLPIQLEAQAKDLLARLDHLEDRRPSVCAKGIEPARGRGDRVW